MAGPCVIESRDHCLRMAEHLARVRDRLGLALIFKASYDKANRTSIRSYRGPGPDQGLEILREVQTGFGLPVMTDVHETGQVGAAAEVVDVLQIPAFLCRQTDLILACAQTGKHVNITKGQFLAPWDMQHAVEKARSTGSAKLMLTERGTSFGYGQLVVDFRSLVILRRFGVPVVFDATHSVQLPGGAGDASSGNPEFIAPLARAAVGVGVSGLFMEVHDNPAKALSDGPNALPLHSFEPLAQALMDLDAAARAAGAAPQLNAAR